MQNTTKQLIQFSITGFLLIACIIVSSGYYANELVKEQNEIVKSALVQLDKTSPIQDIKIFTKQIKMINAYDLLKVLSNEGEQIHNFTSNNSTAHFLITNDIQTVRLGTRDISVKFALDISSITSLFNTFVMVLSLVAAASLALLYTLIVVSANRARKLDEQNLVNQVVTAIDSFGGENKSMQLNLPALNTALSQLETKFEKNTQAQQNLENVAYIDTLTKLANRSRFVQFIEHNTADEPNFVKFGVLCITRCSELQTINQIHGYHEGDKYISHVADIISSQIHTYKRAQLFRLNSSDFACLIPNVTLNEAEKFANALTGKLNEYQLGSELDSVAFTGIVQFDAEKPLGELLALADTAISVAQTLHKNAWYIQKDASILESSSSSYGNQNWRQEIDSVIENQRLRLLTQLIQPSNNSRNMYSEILARFINEDGDVLPTAPFIAMAEKLDKIIAVDRLIIEHALKEISSHHMPDQRFGINVSPRSIHDEHFLIWLERKLLKESDIAPRLVFEISEFGLQQNIKTGKRFIDMLHRSGAKVAVERFGVGLTSFKFFKDLKPDFIKMDGSYTRNIEEDKNNQYFLRIMIDLAHRLNVKVLVESVETLDEKEALDMLLIDGAQGFLIGKPSPL